MKQAYIQKRFSRQNTHLLYVIDRIMQEYADKGFDLSLRQLYYQLVATAYNEIPDTWTDKKTGSKNNERAYDNLGSLVNDGRLAGVLDWDVMTDRGRVPYKLAMWEDPVDRLDAAARTYRLAKWHEQPNYVYVMAEKEALEGVMTRICSELEVPFLKCKGYASASSLRDAGLELMERRNLGQDIHLIYLGDFDPSGLNMTDDIKRRMEMFSEGFVDVHRIALNMDQIETYNPPPNPAKQTDSRFKEFASKYGTECWEVDALNVDSLMEITRDAVDELRDDNVWETSMERQEHERHLLKKLAYRVRTGEVKLTE